MAANLSGQSYVAARLNEPGETLTKIKISVVKFCDHTGTICAECAYMWAWDYELYYQRTIGGRRLKAQLEAKGQQVGSK